MDKTNELRKATQEALCTGCDNYKLINFYGFSQKSCYCDIDPLKCVIAQKKLKKGLEE